MQRGAFGVSKTEARRRESALEKHVTMIHEVPLGIPIPGDPTFVATFQDCRSFRCKHVGVNVATPIYATVRSQ
jgi:hypothetical protein